MSEVFQAQPISPQEWEDSMRRLDEERITRWAEKMSAVFDRLIVEVTPRALPKEKQRENFVRWHAPAILSGMYAGGLAAEYSAGELRLKSQAEAGLVFDETEPKD
jgi:hypothetical protein